MPDFIVDEFEASMNGEASPGRLSSTPINRGVSTNAAGDLELVPAPGEGKRVVLLGYVGSSAADNDLDWRSGGDSLCGPIAVAGRAHLFAYAREGLASCSANAPLVLNSSAATQVSLLLTYVIEQA